MPHPKHAATDQPIHEILARRWSPYVFQDQPVSTEDLRSLFEAARWAASSYNEQPWRYLVAVKAEPAEFEKALSCLLEANQQWAKAAPVLAFGCVQLRFSHNNKPNGMAIHDLGLASGNLTAEATARGLAVHQMAGILPDRVREMFGLPENTQAITALAIGYPAAPDDVPESMRSRDLSPRARKPLSEFVFSGGWGQRAGILSSMAGGQASSESIK